MGLMLDTRTGRVVTLSTRSLVGRSPLCSIVVTDDRVSAEHAAISWSGRHWQIRDLGSRNGTWLDQRRLRPGEQVALRRDAKLGFGASDDAWWIVDDRAAGPGARNESSAEVVCSDSMLLALPSARDPRVTLSRGAGGGWLLEESGVQREVADGDLVEIDGDRWRLFLPLGHPTLPVTADAGGRALTLAEISLLFVPSSDEEHVDLRLRTNDGEERLLPPRTSHYLLLTLARIRIRDAEAGFADGEQGWIHASDLADMLRYTAERLNLEIFRARSGLAKIGLADSMQLVERRTSSRQLRLGVARARVSVRRA